MQILKDDTCGSLKMVIWVQMSLISITVGINICFGWADHKWSGETHRHLHLVLTRVSNASPATTCVWILRPNTLTMLLHVDKD